MSKNNFLSEIYNEFIKNITWSKWNDLQYYTILVAFSTIILAIIFYIVDEIFIWFLQKIFSIHF